jgi:hypothetical protein
MAAPSDISIENLTGTWMLVGSANYISSRPRSRTFANVCDCIIRTNNFQPTPIRYLQWYLSEWKIVLHLLTLYKARH